MSNIRELVLDTETTGLNPETGDKLVEIGIVELIGHRPSGKDRHFYINPQRSVPLDAFNIHGLDYDFLKDKPLFSDIADELLAFIGNDKIIIHNASFDIKFLNTELLLSNKRTIDSKQTFCTLEYARKRDGNKRSSLDALSKEFRNDVLDRLTVNRTKNGGHGALLDSYILAEVYLGLIGGREPDMFSQKDGFQKKEQRSELFSKESGFKNLGVYEMPARSTPLKNRLTKKEIENHKAFITKINGLSKWSVYN